jgi:hypothetical protein
MNTSGISRRNFIAALIAGLGAGACTSIPVPKMGEGPPRVPAKSAIMLGPAPIKGGEAKFAFTQVSGAPASHVLGFTRAINSEAAARHLNVVPDGDPSATYLVRGYLSAIGDGRGTLLVYVWDVTDTNGKRLHRVTGQETAGGSASDPLSGVDEEAVQSAAKRTIDDLAAWIS